MLLHISDHKAYNMRVTTENTKEEKEDQRNKNDYITYISATISPYRHCSQVRGIDMEAILILYYQITSYSYIQILTKQRP